MNISRKMMAGLLASTALAAPAFAQTAGDPAQDQAGSPAAAEVAGAAQEIVVTGVRGSQLKSVDIKRKETALVDAISAEDIGKLPDVTIVDALQRIPGIQITRNAGEGTNVNIRGLPQVVTLLNGEQYLSPGNLGQAQPNLNDVPAQLMNAVVVYKSTDPRNALSGISGTIDLRTRRPFDMDYGWTLSAQAEYATGDYTKEDDYLVSGLASWQNERVGVLVSAAQSNSHLGNNYAGSGGGLFGNNDWGGGGSNWIDPHGFEAFTRVVERDRLGISGAVQLRIGEGFTLTGEVFHTEFTEHNRAAGLNISNRWTSLGWTNPTAFEDSGTVGSNGQPWLDVSEYDLDVWWFNSFTVNRTTKSHSTNYNLQLDYDNDENFTFSARAMRANANYRSMNGQAQGDLSICEAGGGHTFTLFRDPNDPTRGPFYPASIAALYPASRYSNGIVGSNGGRYIDPNLMGYGVDPQLHLALSPGRFTYSGFDRPIASGGLGAGATLADYMANLGSYTVTAFSSEGNQENSSELGVFRADGSYEFDDDGLFGFFKRVDVGLRRSDRDVSIRAFHLFSNFYAGNGASEADGCSAQWKAVDVVMNQDQCQAGEMVPNPAYDPTQPAGPGNEAMVFQGYTVNRPVGLDEYNNVIQVNNLGDVNGGIPAFYAIDPRDFDDVVAFQNRVFGNTEEVIIPGRTYDVQLVEEMGYLNTAVGAGGFSGEIGVKLINTRLTVKQNLTGATRNYGDTNLDTGDQVTKRDYIDVLPSVNLTYDVTPNLRLRAAYSKTMIPLDLGNYGGGLTIATSDSQGPTPTNPAAAPVGVRQVTSASSSGNPYLDPWRSDNYDIAAEYYLGNATLFSIGAFRLDISSFVTTATTNTGRFPDQDGVIRRTVPVTQPTQGSGGSLQGIEAGMKIAFSDFLSGGFFSNFGLDANYTYSDSEQETRDLSGERLPFTDNSKHQINVIGWYQDDNFQVRVAWNHRTPRLSSTFGVAGSFDDPNATAYQYIEGAETRNIPIFQDTTDYVDVNVTYNINDMFALYGNVSNLTGETERYYMEFDSDSIQPHSVNQFEPRYSAGVRVKF